MFHLIQNHTRTYLQEFKRVKSFHFKYLLYIILDYMNKPHLLKYFNNINKKTEKKKQKNILQHLYEIVS